MQQQSSETARKHVQRAANGKPNSDPPLHPRTPLTSEVPAAASSIRMVTWLCELHDEMINDRFDDQINLDARGAKAGTEETVR